MKLKYIFPIFFISLINIACSSDDDTLTINEIEGLLKVKDITNETHTIEIFTKSGVFNTGYNNISIRIKDKTDTFIENATINWVPVMHMPTMQHSCPKSRITKVEGKNTVYQGYVIYQMTNTDNSGWSLSFNYIINGVEYIATDTISVLQYENQNVTTFMGSDETKYILALIEPNNPKIAINNLKVGLYKMENMMSFPVVENYTIALDPRMPGMGNHTSPNNTDLTFNKAESMYNGDLSLTMTGFWVLNLKLLNEQGIVLKGEDITEANTQSSLFLELEF